MEALAPLLALPCIEEVGRALCLEMGYEYPGAVSDQESFKARVLDLQIRAEDKLDSFISDRSTIDAWVLWQRWQMCQAMSYDTEAFYEKTKAQALLYTDIIYIPVSFAAVEDGFRWTDADYRKQIDRITRMTLYEWNLLDRTCTLTADHPAERVKEALDWLHSR